MNLKHELKNYQLLCGQILKYLHTSAGIEPNPSCLPGELLGQVLWNYEGLTSLLFSEVFDTFTFQ